jgi:16S rRNA (guanine966-N2)-methyltransferase
MKESRIRFHSSSQPRGLHSGFILRVVRVIDGKYRRRPLMSTPSPRVRPTARRLRETLFELLGARVLGVRFLDLCAGSGAVGIEALSRGAGHVTFVDRSAKICSLITENLGRCGVCEDQAEVRTGDAILFLRRTELPPWDIVFFDPPYRTDYAPVLSLLGTAALIKRPGGILIAEHHCEHELKEREGRLRRRRKIRQGDSCLSFYEYR